MMLLEEAQNKKAAEYYMNLEKQYRVASINLEKEISAWYQRFAGNNGVSMFEAKTLLNTNQLAEFKWTVKEYIAHGEANALDGKWMKELENASAKVHVTRLEALKMQLQQQAEVLYSNQVSGISGLMKDVYETGYYHTAFELQKGFKIGWDVQTISDKQIENVLTKPWTVDNNTFRDRCWTDKNKLVSSVQTNLTQTIMRGDAPDKAIKNIAKEFNVSKNKAGKLIMTESAAFSSISQKDCFNALDVTKFEIVATLDSHTSELCQGLDGSIFEMIDYQVGVTAPPFHPWCRTTTAPSFEDDAGGKRAARDADGKTYYVDSNMKYPEWKQTFVDGGTKTGLKVVVNV